MKNFKDQNLLYKTATTLIIIICLVLFLFLIYDIWDKFTEKRTTTSVSYSDDKVSISTIIHGIGRVVKLQLRQSLKKHGCLTGGKSGKPDLLVSGYYLVILGAHKFFF